MINYIKSFLKFAIQSKKSIVTPYRPSDYSLYFILTEMVKEACRLMENPKL